MYPGRSSIPSRALPFLCFLTSSLPSQNSDDLLYTLEMETDISVSAVSCWESHSCLRNSAIA